MENKHFPAVSCDRPALTRPKQQSLWPVLLFQLAVLTEQSRPSLKVFNGEARTRTFNPSTMDLSEQDDLAETVVREVVEKAKSVFGHRLIAGIG